SGLREPHAQGHAKIWRRRFPRPARCSGQNSPDHFTRPARLAARDRPGHWAKVRYLDTSGPSMARRSTRPWERRHLLSTDWGGQESLRYTASRPGAAERPQERSPGRSPGFALVLNPAPEGRKTAHIFRPFRG